jgi:hypothetical protein
MIENFKTWQSLNEDTIRKLVNLMLKSSDTNPDKGKLSKSDNVISAIELAKRAKEFSDNGQSDEAMNIESDQWEEVIRKLEEIPLGENMTDIKGSVERSRTLTKEMKEKLIPFLTSSSRYDNGRVFNLSGWNLQTKGSSLGADKNGFFCYTHRARSESYESPDKIPAKEVKFIESTG